MDNVAYNPKESQQAVFANDFDGITDLQGTKRWIPYVPVIVINKPAFYIAAEALTPFM